MTNEIRGRVRLFGTYDKNVHTRIEVVRRGLIEAGAEVEEVNRPVRFSTARRVAASERPWKLLGWGGRTLLAWLSLGAAAIRGVRPDVVVVGYLGHFDVLLARVLHPRATIVLDYLASIERMLIDRRLDRRGVRALARILDSLAMRTSDIVMVDTAEAASREHGRARKIVTVPVGASPEWFARPTSRSGPLRVIYFGVYTPLHGAETIGRSISMLADADVEFTMIGTGQEHELVKDHVGLDPHVTWIDWLDLDQLREAVGQSDVCLGIFGTTPKALEVVPTKAYQGAASGALVVTSRTRSQEATLGDAAIYVSPGDPEDLARVLRTLSTDSAILALRQRSHDWASSHYAPRQVVQPLLDALAP